MTPIGTGQAPAPFTRAEPAQVMIDRLVCGDSGNPDARSTQGKRVVEAKRTRPHHNSHDALDQGADVQEEVRNAGRAVVVGELSRPK